MFDVLTLTEQREFRATLHDALSRASEVAVEMHLETGGPEGAMPWVETWGELADLYWDVA
ncbi:hypothetical protein ACTMTF_15285 [Nonomuraea sp. ZG12]|uniref:hypothetical protein n=1 Tax=Nonomuraea sp. ZG12 TaxID=3452207 RepID=UPI003F8AED67